MALTHSPSIVTNGLAFYYDMANTEKSWRGASTTNLLDTTMSIYNNVPGDVSAVLVQTTEVYRGAPVWRLTLTPTTASGVSWLSSGNNPGIGVVTGGGGGLANRFTGHAIFYRSTVPMHSTPLFTNYSNIAGWGAGALGSNRSVLMGDGWSRGEVVWFDTVTRSDGKYWAINPANATLNVPIVILWAAPFKEDRNDSNYVSAYTPGTRSNTQAIRDLTNNNTITENSLTYSSAGTFSFNGSSSFLSVPNSSSLQVSDTFTINVWINATDLSTNRFGIFSTRTINTAGSWQIEVGVGSAGQRKIAVTGLGTWIWESANDVITTNTWHNICFVKPGNATQGGSMYLNGNLLSPSVTTAYTILNNNDAKVIGQGTGGGQFFPGRIDIISLYNRALTAAEVQQNFQALRGRYGI